MNHHYSHRSVTVGLWAITAVLLPTFCNEGRIFLQSSTAVFLAALPAPPLLKITGRVSQGIQFKSLISCFRLIKKKTNKAIISLYACKSLYFSNMLADHHQPQIKFPKLYSLFTQMLHRC